MPVRHVFVYGTLRRGEERDINGLKPSPRWVGRASVTGVMYQLGTYPGVVLGAPGRVQGEVYEISTALERQLDVIEDVWPQPGGEYIKREIPVWLEWSAGESGHHVLAQVSCLIYEIAPDRVLDKPVIADGDWVRMRADKSA